MKRAEERKRLNRLWLFWVVLCLLPWGLLSPFHINLGLPGIAIFLTGLFALFPSLKAFGAFKRALFDMQQTDPVGERERWTTLQRAQVFGLYWAAVPAWLAALGSLSGLGGVPGLMLVIGSLMTITLYRIPQQVVQTEATYKA